MSKQKIENNHRIKNYSKGLIFFSCTLIEGSNGTNISFSRMLSFELLQFNIYFLITLNHLLDLLAHFSSNSYLVFFLQQFLICPRKVYFLFVIRFSRKHKIPEEFFNEQRYKRTTISLSPSPL